MLVVNFDCLRTIPLHDTAVVLPFDEFLKCADAGMAYFDIVKRAIDWRKTNITNNYASKDYVYVAHGVVGYRWTFQATNGVIVRHWWPMAIDGVAVCRWKPLAVDGVVKDLMVIGNHVPLMG